MNYIPPAAALLATAALTIVAAAGAQEHTLIVRAIDHGYYYAPVHSLIQPASATGVAVLTLQGKQIPCQARASGSGLRVDWIVKELAKGQEARYTLVLKAGSARQRTTGITIGKTGKNLEIMLGGKLFTRYDSTTGPNKPYFYPVYGPGQVRITRGYPIEKLPQDRSNDHPHHRGLWFTHGDVDGEDYWSEVPKTGRTVTTSIEEVSSGPVYGRFVARTQWISHEGVLIATDRRTVTVYDLPNGRILDFKVTMTPQGTDLVFGDTKEGSFGVRLADSMRADGSGGHIVTSAGVHDGAAWGTRANWVDCYGPVDNQTVGVTIMDAPDNPRNPTYWHVRDYGLFAANPFGLHEFQKGFAVGAGNLTVPLKSTVTFYYRVFLHKGDTTEGGVSDAWNAFADPPKVEVL